MHAGAPWLVLAAGLLITALVVGALLANGRARDLARLERASEAARHRVEARIEIYVALLRSAAGLLAAEPDLTRADFRTYVARLGIREHYPGVQGIGFTRRLDPAEVPALIAAQRAQGDTAFRLRPDTARPEVHAIVFLEPLDRRNRRAIGYDMFTEPVRRAAMERARDTGRPAMSGRVTLVQEIDARQQAGFLIYVPVYRQGAPRNTPAERRLALEGFAYAPFRADDLFTGIFGRTEARDIELQLHDGSVIADSTLLHASRRRGDGGAAGRPPFADTLRLELGGRQWTMLVTPGPAFGQSSRYMLAPLAGLAGIVVSVILYLLARARRRAILAVARARDLLEQVLEQAPVAISVLRGPDHVVQLANPGYRQLVAGDPVGLPLRDVLPEAESTGLLAILDEVYRTGRPWARQEVELRRDRPRSGDEEPVYFNVLYHPFTDEHSRPIGVVIVAVEVTDEVRARRDAEVARREAEQANRAKSDFLAAMSHELRTPLNAITGYVQLLEIGLHGPVTAPQLEALTRIRRSGSHLLSLINDVLNFAKLEAGRVEFEIGEVALGSALREVLHMVEPQLRAKGLSCRVDIPDELRVCADGEKLRQVLLNLLSNAVKFTERGGITVDVAPPERDGRIRLRVADTGEGIPPDRLASIFDPFVQVHRTPSTRVEGTGLGLAISRDLARGMGADITVTSRPGEGSVFCVLLRPA